jgi:hypothetical protein
MGKIKSPAGNFSKKELVRIQVAIRYERGSGEHQERIERGMIEGRIFGQLPAAC